MNISMKTTVLDYKIELLEERIGNTPLQKIEHVFQKPGVQLFAKLEWDQLGGSVKARPAFEIIKQAIVKGKLGQGQSLLDATSGNTGIAYAIIGDELGIPVTICLPQNASKERVELLEKYNAEIIFTSPFGSTDESQEKAFELASENPDRYFYANQYANENNWKAHYLNTGKEIYEQTKGSVTHFVAGLGTTGTFTGAGTRLKEYNQDIQIISLQPEIAMHGLEGWKHMETAKVPKIYRPELADNSLRVSTEEAYALLEEVFYNESLLISPSAAANLAGAIKVAQSLDSGTVVTVFPDNADKYSEVLETIFNKEKNGTVLN